MSGLRKQDCEVIHEVLHKFTTTERAVMFGIRAMGNFRKGSDIDIAIIGEDITPQTVQKLHYLLNEESLLPYFFDIVHYQHINNEKLTEHIDQFGVDIYTRISNLI